jgi:hypothetical protein
MSYVGKKCFKTRAFFYRCPELSTPDYRKSLSFNHGVEGSSPSALTMRIKGVSSENRPPISKINWRKHALSTHTGRNMIAL